MDQRLQKPDERPEGPQRHDITGQDVRKKLGIRSKNLHPDLVSSRPDESGISAMR